MATVKFTGNIRDNVKEVFNRAYKPRVDALTEKIKNALDSDLILDTYIKNTGGFDLFEKSKHWFEVQTKVGTTYIGNEYCYDLPEFKTGARHVPPRLSDALRNMDVSVLPAVQAWIDLRKERQDMQRELSDKFEEVCRVFNAYPSINTALKNHPDLEHLLPQHVKEKLAEKTERNKQAITGVDIDVSMIKQVAVMSKLAQQGA